MVLQVVEHEGWAEACCPCQQARIVVAGGDAEGVTADEIRGGLDELIAHARACPASRDGTAATAALVSRLLQERFGNPAIGMRG